MTAYVPRERTDGRGATTGALSVPRIAGILRTWRRESQSLAGRLDGIRDDYGVFWKTAIAGVAGAGVMPGAYCGSALSAP